MGTNLLPEQFSDLEPFAKEWALATGPERARQRLSSSIEKIRAFYDAMLPRMDEIITYLNQFPLEKIPEQAKPLFYLTLSLAEVSRPVELYGQPEAAGIEESRFVLTHEPELDRSPPAPVHVTITG